MEIRSRQYQRWLLKTQSISIRFHTKAEPGTPPEDASTANTPISEMCPLCPGPSMYHTGLVNVLENAFHSRRQLSVE